MNDAVDTFRQEAAEHLATLEEALLELEQHPHDEEQIGAAFRAMHTIKGAAGMVGFDHLSGFTHHLETFFDEVRAGRIELSRNLINLVLEAKDHIEQLLETPEPSAQLKVMSEARIKQFAEACHWDSPALPEQEKRGSEKKGDAAVTENLYRVDFHPLESAFTDGFDFIPLLRELSGLGTAYIATFLDKRFKTTSYNAETCYIGVTVLLTTSKPQSAIEDVFFFVSDDWEIQIASLDHDEACLLGELLVENGAVSIAEMEALLSQRPRTGELMVESGLVKAEEVERALGEQQHIRQQQKKSAPPDQSIRVPQHKLDMLMDQVGELVILQARLDQLAIDIAEEQVASLAEELDRLVGELRDTAFDIRMLPIGSTFGRFRRLVRDLTRELGKDVVLETEGAETELDKVVLDRLADPLVHLLRNSLDHGIEMPDVREAAGKPRAGHLHLEATQHQGHILISIRDDGAGIDPEKIRAKALERGLIKASDNHDHQSLFQLIFEPGFSTAQKVTDVSGRGVGMDVVKRSIESLQGRVYIDSRVGVGTTVKISLPMTLAIIDGLMVAVSGERYVLPLNTVEECIELESGQTMLENGVLLIKHRDQLVPCLNLRECFKVHGRCPEIEQTVIVRVGDDLFGVVVDEVIGHFQTVIKNLGRLYQGVSGLMGATIMGDGRIAMILDLPELVEEIRR